MIIWAALILPIIAIFVLLYKFHHKMTIWEYLMVFGVPILAIAISKWAIETSQTSDTEFWGGYVLNSEYYEDWNERVSCRHPKYRTKTDSKGNTTTYQDGYQHSYDVDYHPPYWEINTTIGTFGIPSTRYRELTKRFGNETFVDLHRSYHTDDGDKYVTNWMKEPEKLVPVTDSRRYENRVQASQSVFNFKEVNPKDFDLFEYPKINSDYHQRSILGTGGATHIQAEARLDYVNATLGSSKQTRMFILVFRNQPLQAGIDQESYWKGGNKNEFITCIGVDDAQEVQWVHVFSWSEVEDLKIEARDMITNQKKLDLVAYVNWLEPEMQSRFIRKKFKDFDYLTVEPSMWAIMVTYFITTLICVGLGFWAVHNEHEGSTKLGGGQYAYFR